MTPSLMSKSTAIPISIRTRRKQITPFCTRIRPSSTAPWTRCGRVRASFCTRRLRVNTLHRDACNSFCRFFRPFVRFATAYVSLHNERHRIRTYNLSEASRSKKTAMNALARATQSFNSRLRILPMHCDGVAVVECADEFRITLFSALTEADPQHYHRIVELRLVTQGSYITDDASVWGKRQEVGATRWGGTCAVSRIVQIRSCVVPSEKSKTHRA